MNKATMISWLTTNCGCWSKPGGADTLNGLDDEQVKDLYEDATRLEAAEDVINAVASLPGRPADMTVASMPEFVANLSAAPTGNGGKQTMQEWLSAMPAEAVPVWNGMVEVEKNTRADLVRRLTANMSPERRTKAVATYAKMSTADLRDLLPDNAPSITSNGALDLNGLYDPSVLANTGNGFGGTVYAGDPGDNKGSPDVVNSGGVVNGYLPLPQMDYGNN